MGETGDLLQHVEKMAKKQRTDPTSNRLDDMIASLCGWLQEHCDEAVCPDTPSVHSNCAAQPSEADYERAKSLLALEESLEAASHKDIIHEHHEGIGVDGVDAWKGDRQNYSGQCEPGPATTAAGASAR